MKRVRVHHSITCRTLWPPPQRANPPWPGFVWDASRVFVCLSLNSTCLFPPSSHSFSFPFTPLGVSMPLAFTLIRSPLKYHLLKWSSMIILVKGAEHSSHFIMLFCFLHPLDFFVSSHVNQMLPWNGIRAMGYWDNKTEVLFPFLTAVF